jgi:acylaminoacyl-peptidase
MSGKRKITIEDLYQIKITNDPQINPDGEQVVFTVQWIDLDKNRYFSHLYLAQISSGEVRALTQGKVSDSQPCWSPDGKYIAFHRTKDRQSQIWLIPEYGGESHQLTHLPEGRIGSVAWSPHGLHLAFEFRQTHPNWTQDARQERESRNLSDPPRVIDQFHYRADGLGFLDTYQQIWVCEVRSGLASPITDGDWDARCPVWSPDSSSIAFISNRSEDAVSRPFEEDIWIVQKEGGLLRKLCSPEGYKQSLSWSPDSQYLAYIGSRTIEDPWGARNDRIWILPLGEGEPRCLTENLDRITENASLSDLRGTGNQNPTWSNDSSTLYFLVSDRGSCHLYSVNLDAEIKTVVGGNVDISGFGLGGSQDMVVVLASTTKQPAEIYTVNLDDHGIGTSLTPLTNINAAWLLDVQLCEPEEVWIKSTDDTDVQGWLLKPPQFDTEKTYPMVFYIHGGPAAQYANTFFHEFQVLAAQGYVVFYTNPRGSLGREEAFATCITGDWGNLDYQDLMAAVEYAQGLPYINKDRMAVVGGSYGGFMVTWIIGQTDRFCCAITERGVSNRHSAVGTTDFPPMPDGYWPGNAWNRPERLWAQSPLGFAGNINTPLLIIHSEGDLRCPIGQAEQLYSALKRLKQEVVFLRYPAETSHGLSRNGPPDLRIDRLQRIVRWLETYLKK